MDPLGPRLGPGGGPGAGWGRGAGGGGGGHNGRGRGFVPLGQDGPHHNGGGHGWGGPGGGPPPHAQHGMPGGPNHMPVDRWAPPPPHGGPQHGGPRGGRSAGRGGGGGGGGMGAGRPASAGPGGGRGGGNNNTRSHSIGHDDGTVVTLKQNFGFATSRLRPNLRGVYFSFHDMNRSSPAPQIGHLVEFDLVSNGGDPNDDRSYRAVGLVVKGPDPTFAERQAGGGREQRGRFDTGWGSGSSGYKDAPPGRADGATEAAPKKREEPIKPELLARGETGVVKAIKEAFGFIKADEPKYGDLFYHNEDVMEGGEPLKPGDRVEFGVTTNRKTGEYRAAEVKNLGPSQSSDLPSFKPSWMSSGSMPGGGITAGPSALTGSMDKLTLAPGGGATSLRPGGGLGIGAGAGTGSTSLRPGGGLGMGLGGGIMGGGLRPGGGGGSMMSGGPGAGWGGGSGGGGGSGRTSEHSSRFTVSASDLFGDQTPTRRPGEFGTLLDKEAREMVASRDSSSTVGAGRGAGGGRTPGAKSAPRVPRVPPEPKGKLVSDKETGYVKAVKEGFGFIKCESDPRFGDLFYHVDDVLGKEPDLDDRMEFGVDTHRRTGEYRAVQLVNLSRPELNYTEEQLKELREQAKEAAAGGRAAATVADGDSFAGNVSAAFLPGGAKQKRDPKDRNATYQAFPDRRSLMGWLEKRSAEEDSQLVLNLTNFIRPLEDIVDRTELPAEVLAAVLRLLTRKGVRRNVLRERTEIIYRRLLDSALVQDPSNLRRFLAWLPTATGGATQIVEGFTSVVALFEECLQRFPGEGAAIKLPVEELANAARRASLPYTLEETIHSVTEQANRQRMLGVQNVHGGDGKSAGKKRGVYDMIEHGGRMYGDFRDVPIFPTTEEILSGEPPALKPNIVEGYYESPLEYLDTHFRLLREDCIAPLRQGVREYLGGDTATRDLRVYHDVRIVAIQCGREGVYYRISFRLPPGVTVSWERSKRLMYGSLLLLSPDNFKTLLWATVAQRDNDLVSSVQQIDIRFPDGLENRFAVGTKYIMAESATTYFEAYQHTLRALQSVAQDVDNLPFADYLLKCRPNVGPPAYLRMPGADRYVLPEIFDDLERDTGREAVHILQDWPVEEAKTLLDQSQLRACYLSLTRELALIQGPPGTGKTFVGLKVVQTLLQNYRARQQGPILIICFTNHALDQFLEGIYNFEPDLVRIGSRSKSEVLQACNLRQRLYDNRNANPTRAQARKSLMARGKELEKLIAEKIEELNSRELTLEDVEAVCEWEQLSSLKAGNPGAPPVPQDQIMDEWLEPVRRLVNGGGEDGAEKPEGEKPEGKGSGKNRRRRGKGASKPKEPLPEGHADAEDEEAEADLDVVGDGDVVSMTQMERMVGDDDVEKSRPEAILKLAYEFGAEGDDNMDMSRIDDVWSLDAYGRARLYSHWRHLASTELWTELEDMTERYERVQRERRQLDEEAQLSVLRSAAIVGMTTTGVAKYQHIVAELGAEVVVVEEAAEVLEAHIISSISRNTRHVILIGDHQQLRPGTAVYELAKRFHLDVSLFERLIRNGVEHQTLLRQRRMRPAISKLMKPIYKELGDHPDVDRYPHALGMPVDLFFLNHTHAESFDGESRSRSNTFEADFTVALTVHLLKSGYAPDRITVITTYSGQVFNLRKQFREPGMQEGLDEVRLKSVDQFQGEEADVIILSLVRSNETGDIGFLSVSNRVVVALSRARHAMYILGNGQLLASRSDLWKQTLNYLNDIDAVGPLLPVRGVDGKTVLCGSAEDFEKVPYTVDAPEEAEKKHASAKDALKQQQQQQQQEQQEPQ